MAEEGKERRGKLLEKLSRVEEHFARQMRERGFDAAQVENIALPGPLVKLYAEREELRAELEELEAEQSNSTDFEQENPMNEIARIVEQLKRGFEGGAWHGPGVMEILNGVTARQAAARPIPGAHSIWELVLHIAAWESACRRRLEGDRAELPTEEDWPHVADTSDEAWETTIAALKDGHRKLRESVARLDESRLDAPILQGMSSVYATLHGAVQHDLYHAGQIAVLKKAV